jgi:hypothetical protein
MLDATPSSSSTTAAEPNAAEEVATVATYQSPLEADLVRAELEMAGIQAWTTSAIVSQAFVTLPETGVGIEVAAADAGRARQVIASLENSDLSQAAEEQYAGAATVDVDAELQRATTETQATMYDDAEAGG